MNLSQVYTKGFFEHMHRTASPSATAMVPIVLELIRPKSVIDVGCGTGEWLLAFQEYGIDDILGIDGDYIDRSLLALPQEHFKAIDLAKPFVLDRTYDLAVCLEVAEHLAPECASDFITSLTQLAPIILFSAAIPFQGGNHHVNEQWPEYWAELFASKGFVPIDIVRQKIWNNDQIELYYRQNTLLFCTKQIALSDSTLNEAFRATDPSKLALVHPEFFVHRSKWYREYITWLEHMTVFQYMKSVARRILRKGTRK